jgi:hypothetical protein
MNNNTHSKFSVATYSIKSIEDSVKWEHWSKDLKMVIEKDGVTIKLDETEIQKLVKSLPRTFGGTY